MEDRLPHGDDLLKQLCLEGGVPRSSPHAKAMQSFMGLDGRQYPTIDDAKCRLPQDLHQANLPEVGASTLGDHHRHLPGARRREFSSPEGRPNDGDNLLPVPSLGCSSHFATRSHNLRCSALILDGPPA